MRISVGLMLPSGKSSPFRYKTEKNISFLCIDAGHLELPRVDPRGDGGGVGHDGTDAGYPVGLRSGGSRGDWCRCAIGV